MYLMGNWSFFIDTEFNLFSITPMMLVLYFFIALICKVIVPISGPAILKGNYFINIEQYGYDEDSVLNILFRVMSPVLISFFCIFILFCIEKILPFTWSLSIRWMPVAIYWAIYTLVVTTKRGAAYPMWTVLVQGLMSLTVALYFDWVVVCNFPESGIVAFDQSNIGWQVLVFGVTSVCFLVLFGIRRGLTRYKNKFLASSKTDGFLHIRRVTAQSIEKKISGYIRKFENRLPERFKQDPLLHALFYTVMLIEDTNRPKQYRWFENMLFWTGKVKSTGIMQVRSEKKLSDNESVDTSIAIIQDIWESFIKQVAKANQDIYTPTISFTQNWYKYDHDALLEIVLQSIDYLYGKYCGTFIFDASKAYFTVSYLLDLKNNFKNAGAVYVKSQLFKTFADFLPNRELCFENHSVTLVSDVTPSKGRLIKVINNNGCDELLVKDAIKQLSNVSTVVSVEYVPGIRCVIAAITEKKSMKTIASKLSQWAVVASDPNIE